MTDRWHDNWREDESSEQKIERRFATVDKLGEFHGSEKPSLFTTKATLDVLKGEHCHLAGDRDVTAAAAAENRDWAEKRFASLGFEYDEVYSLALQLGLRFADMLIGELNEAGEMNEADLRGRLMVALGDTWVDGLLIGAEHRKAVE